ncbi:hypothetical protein RM616_12585 [Mammaliicoccus sciuri]|uniref:hypothetical protein n=1 Tax=Mammaliicoccus sciuri TaxID=1296 RepID=UPI002885688B|nr:hypothetical protein [Mammaliicoccus sciuri]MDT0670415.1 hypothetical protein [Mammaliicoccus sciuri]
MIKAIIIFILLAGVLLFIFEFDVEDERISAVLKSIKVVVACTLIIIVTGCLLAYR